MRGYIYYAIAESVKSLFANQPDLNKFTNQTRHHEPNHSFHIANECWKYFPWLKCDFDVAKPNYGGRRPDIIFHERGVNEFNLLVVEVKRETSEAVKDWKCGNDEHKILEYWFQGELNYRFGLSLIVNDETSNFAFALFENETRTRIRFNSQEIQKNLAEEKLTEIAEIVKRLIEAKDQNIAADTNELENEINALVDQSYGFTDGKMAVVEAQEA